ncbi:MAG: sigma factor, partial [Saprospiraceae bacterium]
MRPFQHDGDERYRSQVFETECLKHFNAVFRFALYLTKDQKRGEDLAQDTMIKAFLNINQYTEGTNAKAWLLRICYTAFVNGERKRKRQPKIGSDDESALRVPDPTAPTALNGYSDEVTRAL